MPEAPEPTALYRLYDAEDDLLYVGISRTPEARFKAHAHEKNWWHCVKSVDLTWFASFPEAKRAESAAHHSERPPYNSMARNELGWGFSALRYDDSAERAGVRRRLLAELQNGAHSPGTHLWPFQLGKEYGYSRSVTHAAMEELAVRGYLTWVGRTFAAPDQLPAFPFAGHCVSRPSAFSRRRPSIAA